MPYYRSRPSRRFKRRSDTRRKSYKRRQSFKRSNNQAVTQFKLKKVYSASSDSFGNIVTTIQPSSVTTCTDWSSLQTLYDNFKVVAIKKELRPYSVGNESSTAGANVRGNLVSIADMDYGSLPSSLSDAVQYNSCKFLNSRTAQTRYLKIPKQYRSQINDMALGFDADNKDSVIMFRGDGYGASQLQYWVLDTFYVQCIGRR